MTDVRIWVVIFLAAMACCCTHAAVWRVVFRKQWELEQMEFLREKFGNSPTDEIIVFEFWRTSVRLWTGAALIFWVSLAYELATVF